ncbi:hypothetical protein [Pseudomonas knackmussii]|uniref:hypothetical protein n=1 Tax=Pseudomonas knackmussii TaxID=65741 RepID=UPI001F2B8290|nr:hypothetical protein [Pseudomonas knackmussii]
MSRAREKNTVEDYRALDVRELQRHGVLVAGWRGKWQWSRDGEVRASIGLEVESLERLRLCYQVTFQGRAEAKDYPVRVTWTPCHLGGSRPWFLCPDCGRRVAKIYSHGVFACRHCLRLNYRCQQVSKRDVASDRSFKLRDTLGCDEGFLSVPAECIPKPKGMHWRTFNRKIAQLKAVDGRAWGDARALLDRLERRVRP